MRQREESKIGLPGAGLSTEFPDLFQAASSSS